MNKFQLVVNDNQSEGFKLSMSSDDEKGTKMNQELALKLIEKIEKITIQIGSPDWEKDDI